MEHEKNMKREKKDTKKENIKESMNREKNEIIAWKVRKNIILGGRK